jgi:hypothetical protein
MNTTSPDFTGEMCNSMRNGAIEVFRTMLELETKRAALLHEWHAPGEAIAAGSAGFAGDVKGIIYVQVTTGFTRTLAGRLCAPF